MSICFFHCVGSSHGIDILRGPTRELMFSSRAAYARSMLLTRAYADLRGRHSNKAQTHYLTCYIVATGTFGLLNQTFCPTLPDFLPNPARFFAQPCPNCDVDGWATTLKTTPTTTRGLRGAYAAPTRNSYLYVQLYIGIFRYTYKYILS